MAVKKTQTGYQVQYYDADGRFRKRTFRGVTRDEAVRKEREILAARDRGELLPDPKRAPTFASFAESWMDEYRSGWKPSTLEDYKMVIESKINPEFGSRRISLITESHLLRFITALQDQGLSPRRINFTMGIFKAILRTAHRRRVIRNDPSASIRKLKTQEAEIDPLSPEEVERFLAACPPWWRPYFTAAFWTGARPNELIALKWGDMNQSEKTFRIRAGRYRGVESTPKTRSSIRDVDILPPVMEALKAQKAQQASNRLRKGRGAIPVGEDYVFTGMRGEPVIQGYIREQVWYPTLKKAALRRRTAYQTRHTFASNALMAGEDPSWVKAIMGHSNLQMLFGVYARFIPNRTRRDGSEFTARMAGARDIREEKPKAQSVSWGVPYSRNTPFDALKEEKHL